MAVHNASIAETLRHVADLLEIEGANPFRIRAYRRAALTIEDLPQSAAKMVAEGKTLVGLPGIGKDLAGKIAEIVKTGRLGALTEIEARTPTTLTALTTVPGLGPKRVHRLHEAFGIKTLKDLERAARAHKIRELRGFTAKTEEKILAEIERGKEREQRFKIATAEDFAQTLCAYLQSDPAIGRVIVAGSYRRRKDTVGDLDILVTCAKGQAAVDHFVAYDEVAKIIAKGSTRATVMLRSGIQVDLRVVPARSYGAALHYFTGSKSHNIACPSSEFLGQRAGSFKGGSGPSAW